MPRTLTKRYQKSNDSTSQNGIEPHSNNESGNKTEDDHNFEEQLGERH